MALPFLFGGRERGFHLPDTVLSPRTSLQPTNGDCSSCGCPRGATLALLDPQEVSLSLRSETRIPIVLLTSSGSSVPFMQRAECDPFALGSFFLRPHEPLHTPSDQGTHLSGTEAPQLIVKSGERSTPCGCPLHSHVVEGRSPEDPWTRIPRPRQGVALTCQAMSATP